MERPWMAVSEATPEQCLASAVIVSAIEDALVYEDPEATAFFDSRLCLGWLAVIAPSEDPLVMREMAWRTLWRLRG